MNECYYCNAKPVHKDTQGFVYIHNAECPILEREVKAMVEDKTPQVTNDGRRKFYG